MKPCPLRTRTRKHCGCFDCTEIRTISAVCPLRNPVDIPALAVRVRARADHWIKTGGRFLDGTMIETWIKEEGK
jgi:hypothetical protein